ncbi:unnamed protein product [Pieris macdunnoughi]|uniref:Uncharacterized protein n=1 Tax=Pieris macdunnoughi TaxID=345717 RepID=A0A821SCM7_9NEOP|nr:unnamed protein product [Pieris macdunnoughi]
MLVFKEPEECTAHKILYYGILLLIVVYMSKLIKYITKKASTLKREDFRFSLSRNKDSGGQGLGERHRKRQRRKKTVRITTDQWTRERPCHLEEEDE